MEMNRIRELWAEGKTVLNGWLSVGNSFTAEIMAAQGYDSITIDMQHGILGYDASVAMIQALRASGAGILVRVPWLSPADIMKALDTGAHGVICPMINNRAEAEALVAAVRYPPEGNRSYGPSRALLSIGRDYAYSANQDVICLAMIETKEAFRNLDDILSVPGLDGVYVGPADLTFAFMGTNVPPGFDRQEQEMIEAIHTILKAAHRHGKRAALHNGSPEYAATASKWGMDLVTVSNDVRLLSEAAAASVKRYRQCVQEN